MLQDREGYQIWLNRHLVILIIYLPIPLRFMIPRLVTTYYVLICFEIQCIMCLNCTRHSMCLSMCVASVYAYEYVGMMRVCMIYICVCMYLCIYNLCMCMYVCVYVWCIFVYMFLWCMHVCMYVQAYTCLYVHMHLRKPVAYTPI